MEYPSPDWRALEAPIAPSAAETAARPAPLPRRWLAAAGLASVALALAGGALLAASTPQGQVVLEAGGGGAAASDAGPTMAASIPAAARSTASPTPGPSLVVDVEGAVERPGIYRLAAGSRVADAIGAAGGFGPRVDTAAAHSALNLAAHVQDGDQVVVPGLDDPPQTGAAPAAGGAPAVATRAALIDLNRATAEELDSLPGIGPVTSAKIIAARQSQPFRSVDELLARKLVSASTFAKVKDLVTVGG